MSDLALTIVLVDDDPSVEVLFKHSFKEEIAAQKVHLSSFTSSIECMRFIEENPDSINVIFSDVFMPQLSGFELFDKVKQINSHLDLYFISSRSDEELKNKAHLCGAKGYFGKPINFKAIKAVLDNYL